MSYLFTFFEYSADKLDASHFNQPCQSNTNTEYKDIPVVITDVETLFVSSVKSADTIPEPDDSQDEILSEKDVVVNNTNTNNNMNAPTVASVMTNGNVSARRSLFEKSTTTKPVSVPSSYYLNYNKNPSSSISSSNGLTTNTTTVQEIDVNVPSTTTDTCHKDNTACMDDVSHSHKKEVMATTTLTDSDYASITVSASAPSNTPAVNAPSMPLSLNSPSVSGGHNNSEVIRNHHQTDDTAIILSTSSDSNEETKDGKNHFSADSSNNYNNITDLSIMNIKSHTFTNSRDSPSSSSSYNNDNDNKSGVIDASCYSARSDSVDTKNHIALASGDGDTTMKDNNNNNTETTSLLPTTATTSPSASLSSPSESPTAPVSAVRSFTYNDDQQTASITRAAQDRELHITHLAEELHDVAALKLLCTQLSHQVNFYYMIIIIIFFITFIIIIPYV